jgi:hypothetical protein
VSRLSLPGKVKFQKGNESMTANGSTMRARLAYNSIDEVTAELLRENKSFVMAELPGVLDRFYQHVGQFHETSAFFRSRDHMNGAKQAQLRHWSMIMEGRFDEEYEQSITRIGETHNRIGLDPRWYIGGYNGLLTGLLTVIAAKLPATRSRTLAIDLFLKQRAIDRKTALQEAVIKTAASAGSAAAQVTASAKNLGDQADQLRRVARDFVTTIRAA